MSCQCPSLVACLNRPRLFILAWVCLVVWWVTQGDLGLNRIEEPGVPAVDVIEEILEEYEEMNEGELPCTLRPDRTNPKLDLSYTAQAKKTYLDIFPTDPLPTDWKSSVQCSNNSHCLYTNVCVKTLPDKTLEFYNGRPSMKTGFRFYRNWLHRTNATWHYKLNLALSPPESAVRVGGRTLFMNPPYPFLKHEGHICEIAYKLPDIREEFPGKIDYMVSVHPGELTKGTENLLRISFKDTNWTVPTYFEINTKLGEEEMRTVCFDEFHSHFGFYNHDVANKFRKNVLEMCDIKPRAEYPKKPKILFFFERGFNRQILNGETLCNSTKNDTSLRVYRDSLEDLPFCERIRKVHTADIIFTNHGSHSSILPAINPGSVVIYGSSKNFIVTEWDLQLYYLRAHVLKLYQLLPNQWQEPVDLPFQYYDFPPGTILQKDWITTHDFYWREQIQNINTKIEEVDFFKFLNYAKTIFGRKQPFPCEVPLKWPVDLPPVIDETGQVVNADSDEPLNYSKLDWEKVIQPARNDLLMWRQFGWEQMYTPCEPPNHSVCCRDKYCGAQCHLNRPF